MNAQKAKNKRRDRRRKRVRKSVIGTPVRPRVCIFRSLNHIYAQVIDDMSGKTLCAASSLKSGTSGNAAGAAEVGKAIAEKATQAGITEVVFDRNGFPYHGRVRALAEAARKAGLKF
jgi:large subunit ribosomal protein L18